MARKKLVASGNDSFGRRLAALRTEAGLSQRAFAKQAGLSQRMVAYYEGRATPPPGHVLAALADVLGTSTDGLLGLAKPLAPSPRKSHPRLWLRFRQIEKLPTAERKQLFSVIDAFLERHQLASAKSAA
jgi:transcriptional regulator with XRE-family HTH domain